MVEGTPLLRVQAGNRLEGSNPFRSATSPRMQIALEINPLAPGPSPTPAPRTVTFCRSSLLGPRRAPAGPRTGAEVKAANTRDRNVTKAKPARRRAPPETEVGPAAHRRDLRLGVAIMTGRTALGRAVIKAVGQGAGKRRRAAMQRVSRQSPACLSEPSRRSGPACHGTPPVSSVWALRPSRAGRSQPFHAQAVGSGRFLRKNLAIPSGQSLRPRLVTPHQHRLDDLVEQARCPDSSVGRAAD